MADQELNSAAAKAALSLAAEMPWSKVTLSAVAERAELPLTEFYNKVSRENLLDLIDAELDLACASEPVEADATLRERIFDVAMLRFEVMEDHREALLNIRNSWKLKPLARLQAAKRRTRTAKWVLTCANADFAGVSARSVLLSGILFRAEQAWEKETSADFSRTMAQLDRDLRDVDAFVGRVKKFTGSRSSKKTDEASESMQASSS